MEFDLLPIARPPKPIMKPLCSPEVNDQLNVTPEKKRFEESCLRWEQQKRNPWHLKENAESNVLSQPTINSTAIVSKKLDELNRTTFDAPSVVKQELEKSEKLRLDIAEKASGALNYNRKDSKYTALVSLDISSRDLSLQQRKVFKERKLSESKEEPDIMSFMSDHFQFESASLSCECTDDDAEPETVIPLTENVFKLYELIECWKR